MKAALYPAWRVDSILEGKVTVDTAQGVAKRLEPKVWISTSEAYVPGNTHSLAFKRPQLMLVWCIGNPFAPLSYLSFAVPPLPDDLPTYNPSKHLRQLEDDGLEIVPVPFTVSPLGLGKLIRSRIGQLTRWENLKIDESKFKETMVCIPFSSHILVSCIKLGLTRPSRWLATRSCFLYTLLNLSTTKERMGNGNSQS